MVVVEARHPAECGDDVLCAEACCVVRFGDETTEGVERVQDDAAHHVGPRCVSGERLRRTRKRLVFMLDRSKEWVWKGGVLCVSEHCRTTADNVVGLKMEEDEFDVGSAYYFIREPIQS